MYKSPKLLRYGSFRELTRSGLSGSSDQFLFLSVVNPPVVTTDTGGGGEYCPPGGNDVGGSR
jgi:hypothetical protein